MKLHLKQMLYGLLCALFFSAFIYFEYYSLTNKFINTIFGLIALTLLLYIPKKSTLYAGFFIGLFWFYWVGYSFKYKGFDFLIPVVALAFSTAYLLIFSPLYFTSKPYIRAIFLFCISFLVILNWQWMKIELLFIDSYIGIEKYHLALVLFALSLPSIFKNRLQYLAPFLLLFSLNFSYASPPKPEIKIKLISTNIAQNKKWKRANTQSIVSMIFTKIHQAIEEKYELVVFPETSFPLYLNQQKNILQELSHLSENIDIVVGSLYKENGNVYNVSYHFSKGALKIAKKLFLVPFGEYVPLPSFLKKSVNDIFFHGKKDLEVAKNATDFIIKGVKFRNAICYEATTQEIYEGDVKYVIATSNNAWFTPSIEPTLQNLLLKYYARKNSVTIYHAANYKGTGIINN